MKKDLPRRSEVTLKQSQLGTETDVKWFLLGLGAVTVAGIIKTLVLDRFSPPETFDDNDESAF